MEGPLTQNNDNRLSDFLMPHLVQFLVQCIGSYILQTPHCTYPNIVVTVYHVLYTNIIIVVVILLSNIAAYLLVIFRRGCF